MPSTDSKYRHVAPTDDHDTTLLQRRPSLGEEVYDALLSRLISLKIAPGSRIAVDSLVRELGVSQTPIRAALIRLESEGLVMKTHNVGYSATPMPSREQFLQIYELRMLLEPHAAALAARHFSPNDEPELQTLLNNMERPDTGDAHTAYGKFAMQDAAFHAWIAKRSGNTLIEDTLARLHAHMHLFRVRFHARVTQEAIAEHAQIVQALRAKNEAAASAAMLQHLQRSQKRMTPYFLPGTEAEH